jgi:hypothetical protein
MHHYMIHVPVCFANIKISDSLKFCKKIGKSLMNLLFKTEFIITQNELLCIFIGIRHD